MITVHQRVTVVIVAQAVRGQAWATGVTLASAGLLLCFVLYGALFGAGLYPGRDAGRDPQDVPP